MGLTLALFCVGFSALSALPAEVVERSDNDWGLVWESAQAALAGEAGADSFEELLVGAEEGLDMDVARFLLATLNGQQPAFVSCAGLPVLSPESAWAYSLALAPGPALRDCLVLALATCPESALPPVLERGYSEFMGATSARRPQLAVQLGESLHARAGAVWSSQNLAIAYTRNGNYRPAEACLQATLLGELSERDRAVLTSRLSLVQWGEAGLLGARATLGASLCKGNSDSGIILGLFSLERGQLGRAKALFRSVLGQDPSRPWARKGWGLSMVPH